MRAGRAPLPAHPTHGSNVAGVFVNRQTHSHRSLRVAVAAVSLFAFVAASCSDDANDAASATTTPSVDGSTVTTAAGSSASTTIVPSPMGDIVATALTNQVFTELAGLAVDAGLVQALRGGPFTVFAPTDTAFNKLPLDMLHAVQDSPVAEDGSSLLGTVLLHHVVAGGISPDQLAEGELETLAGDKLTVTKVGDTFYVDGNAVGPGVEATNGWVYVMSDVLVPSLGTVIDAAVALQDCCFSTLVSLVTQAELVETLSGAGPFTVFAPMDSAFAAVPEATLNSLVGQYGLDNILLFHVVPGKFNLDQLTDALRRLPATLNVTVGNSMSRCSPRCARGLTHRAGRRHHVMAPSIR